MARCVHPAGGYCDKCIVRPSDPAGDAVAADRDVAKLAAAADKARAEFDEADAAWVDVIRQTRAEELRAANMPLVMSVDGGFLDHEKRFLAQQAGTIKALEARQAELQLKREGAWQRYATARDAHAAAARRVRQQFAQLADIRDRVT